MNRFCSYGILVFGSVNLLSFFNFNYSLLDSIEDEMKLVDTVNKFRCSTSSSGL